MENHHISWENPLLMAIFNSLPEMVNGKSLINGGFNGKIIYKWAIYTMAMLNDQRVNLHFPMVFLWFSYGFPLSSMAIRRSILQAAVERSTNCAHHRLCPAHPAPPTATVVERDATFTELVNITPRTVGIMVDNIYIYCSYYIYIHIYILFSSVYSYSGW